MFLKSTKLNFEYTVPTLGNSYLTLLMIAWAKGCSLELSQRYRISQISWKFSFSGAVSWTPLLILDVEFNLEPEFYFLMLGLNFSYTSMRSVT